MKKIYFYLAFLLLSTGAFAQCVIDTTHLSSPGVYPAASALPHLTQGVAYDQTVQGRIASSMDTMIAIVSAHIIIDSVRLDSITGLPANINWTKNPNVLKGGGSGCVEFTGTTNSPAGTYNLTAWGTAWTHVQVTTFGIDTPYTYTGNLNNFSPFGGYYLTVDAGANTLAVTITSTNVTCYSSNNGTATAVPTGGTTYTYAWSNSANTATVSNLAPGTYTVTVTSGSSTATATCTITQPTFVSASASSTASTGSNGTATVTASGGTSPYTYTWSNTQTTATITSLTPGTYSVTVSDAHGCNTTASTTVVLTGIEELSLISDVQLFPNPASENLNIVAQLVAPSKVQINVIDITGKVVYSSHENATDKLTTSINVAGFAPGVYVLEVGTDKQFVRNRFMVTR